MRKLLIRCYPARWRARYGDEFEALLEERPIGPFDVADIILGAIDARLRLRGRRPVLTFARGYTMSLRIGGLSAIVAGATWAFALVASTGILGIGGGEGDQLIQFALFTLGLLALLVALIGLSAFQAREHPTLVWAAFALPAFGTVVSLFSLMGMGLLNDAPVVAGVSSWDVWVIGLFAAFAGSGLFAIATYRTGALSRLGSTMLAFGSLLIVPALVFGAAGFDALATVVVIITIVGFSLGWIVLGVSAVRETRPLVDSRLA